MDILLLSIIVYKTAVHQGVLMFHDRRKLSTILYYIVFGNRATRIIYGVSRIVDIVIIADVWRISLLLCFAVLSKKFYMRKLQQRSSVSLKLRNIFVQFQIEFSE